MRISINPTEDECGFTILELMAGVLIVGLLLAVAVPSYFEQRRSAVDITVEMDVHNTALAIDTWLADHSYGEVPAFVVKGDGTRTAITINNLNFRQGGYTERPDLNHTITGPLLDIRPSQHDTTLKIVPDDEVGGYRIFGSNNRGSIAYDLPETDEQEGVSYNSIMGGRDVW